MFDRFKSMYMQGSRHGLIYGIITAFAWKKGGKL
jgi:hypothetical protein